MTNEIIDVTTGRSLRNLFGEALIELAPKYDFKVFDADVSGGVGTAKFRDLYPDRFIQCGIAEQAMVGAAAGYAMTANIPVFATTFAVFGARAWEIFRLSAGYNEANVKLVLSHVGVDVGPDGSSAASLEHYALWRSIPGVQVFHPCCQRQMYECVEYMLTHEGPMVLLTGRSELHPSTPDTIFAYGKAVYYVGDLWKPSKTLIVTAGNTAGICYEAVQRTGANLAIISTLSGNDDEFYEQARGHYNIIVVEDSYPYGGLFGIVTERLAGLQYNVKSIAVTDWGESGEADELWQQHGLSVENIVAAVKEMEGG